MAISLNMYLVCIFVIAALIGDTHGHETPQLLGKSYKVDADLTYPRLSDGISIFKNVPDKCVFPEHKLDRYEEYITYYKNDATYYSKTATRIGLDVTVGGSFTLGSTLDNTEKGLRHKTFSGMSFMIRKIVRSTALDKSCRNTDIQYLEFTDKFLNDLEHLSKSDSMTVHLDFISKWGVFVLIEISEGVSVEINSFNETVTEIAENVRLAQMCSSVGTITASTKLCAGVDKEKVESAKSSTMHTSLKVIGGTENSRLRLNLNNKQNKEDLNKIINEAKENPDRVVHLFQPLSELIKARFPHNSKMVKTANRIEQILRGLDFGCTNLYAGNKTPLRWLMIEKESVECRLAHEGCHNNNDCHKTDHALQCYGRTCVEHVKPNPGEKACGARIRKEPSGDTNDVINKSCFMEDDKPKCKDSSRDDQVIWYGKGYVEFTCAKGSILKPAIAIIVFAVSMAHVKSANVLPL